MTHAEPKGRSAGGEPGSESDSGSDPHGTPVRAGDTTTGRAPPLDIHSYLGARLRAVFDDVASQPVPDRFLDLMRQLDKA